LNKVSFRQNSRRRAVYFAIGYALFRLVLFLPSACDMAPAPFRQSHRIEMLVGRSAALCLHPLAAWRSRSRADRVMLLVSYAAISYIVVFGLLGICDL